MTGQEPIDLSGEGQLVDKYGHRHTEAILTAWTPAALKALGVRRVAHDEAPNE